MLHCRKIEIAAARGRLAVADEFKGQHVGAITCVHRLLEIDPIDGFAREIIEHEGKVALAEGWDAAHKGGFLADEARGE